MSTPSNTKTKEYPILGFILAIFLIAVIAMLAWNYGVVAIVAACGGSVSKIGYFTALFSYVAFLLLTAPFRRNRAS